MWKKEEYDLVRGSIVWPQKKQPGIFLVGRLDEKTEIVKVLHEKEFKTLHEVPEILYEFYETHQLLVVCYQDLGENQGFVDYIEKDRQYKCVLRPAPGTGNFDFGIQLINDYIQTDRLSIPSGSIVEQQLTTDWEVYSDEAFPLHGIIALFILLCSFEVNHGLLFPQVRFGSCTNVGCKS